MPLRCFTGQHVHFFLAPFPVEAAVSAAMSRTFAGDTPATKVERVVLNALAKECGCAALIHLRLGRAF
jgi:hypothetical protein